MPIEPDRGHRREHTPVTDLPIEITRQLIFTSPDGSIRTSVFQAPQSDGLSDHDTTIAVSVQGQSIQAESHDTFLGVVETRRRAFTINVDGRPLDVVERVPTTRTVWFGEECRLLTLEEAQEIRHEGKTALEFATGGFSPAVVGAERVVKAADGDYYPAGKDDIIFSAQPV